MRGLVVGALLSIGLATSAQAATFTFDSFTSASGICTLSGGDVQCGPSRATGSATVDLMPNIVGPGLITATVEGQSNANSSFQVFANGMGNPLATILLGGRGPETFSFNFTGNVLDFLVFRTVLTGNGNFNADLTSLTITNVPGPIAGAGLPALLALGGFVWARRRKAAAVT